MFWRWFPQKRCGASLSERPYYRLSRSSRIVAREVGSLRHHVISLNLVKDSLLLIKDLEESRHDEHEGDAGACPSHLKYKLLDDVVHEKALIDEFVEEVVSLVLDQFLTFRNTSLLCLLFASHFDSINVMRSVKQHYDTYSAVGFFWKFVPYCSVFSTAAFIFA